jgi:drug/metabolite transporter (DMT)-like permease
VSVAESAPLRLTASADTRRGQLYVGLGAIAWSSAGLLQRELSVPPATQLAGRALFALLTLLAFVAVSERRRGVARAFLGIGRAGIAVALLMAVSSGAFMIALSHASVARLLFITAIAPLVAALLARVLLGEEVASRTWAAMLIALAGVGVMLSSGAGGDRTGDVLAIVCMLAFAVTIVLTRRRHDISMAPATCLSQLLVVVAALPFANPGAADGKDVVLLVLFGAGQIGLGLALLTTGARLIPAAQTALLTLLEIVLGPLWVWLAYAEQPGTATLVGGTIVLAGILVQIGDPARILRRSYEPASG